MNTSFTSKQREVLARKLGYDGPMQGFDEFLQSSPALMMRYNAVSDKYAKRMAKGGVVGYAVGGAATREQAITDLYQKYLGRKPDSSGFNSYLKGNLSVAQIEQDIANSAEAKKFAKSRPAASSTTAKAPAPAPAKAPAPAPAKAPAPAPAQTPGPVDGVGPLPPDPTKGAVKGGGNVTFEEEQGRAGVPTPGQAAGITPAATPITPEQTIAGVGGAGTATEATTTQAGTAAQATEPTQITAKTAEATQAAEDVKKTVEAVKPVAGTVSEQAQVVAAEQTPTTTAVSGVDAAQLTEAQKVQAPQERKVEAGELLSGSAVDAAKMEQAIAETKAAAAQGEVTEDMTTQGQLAKLTANFDAKNPPAWAAGALRMATATLAQRGLGASSMAGQAIVQAAIEAALPIATADAATYRSMAEQNLSNRQAMAVMAAQQRAVFLGQEFDQEFQARAANAARIADIANVNFTARQQIALENARLAQSVDLANLSNQQAMVLAEVAQIATLETANLNNRQQAAVVNAQNFLAMDMANLDREQQTTLFRSQQITQALLSDAAAENAMKQFNATSQNQVDQFMASLATQVNQFNASQKNAIEQFNTDQVNAVAKFNAEQINARQQFNATQRLVIDQSNAQWRRDVSTADTAAVNAANYLNAQNLQQMTLAEYNNETQLYRDQIQMMWNSFEKDADRVTQLAVSEIAARSETTAASTAAKASMWGAVGTLLAGIDW